jgi:hypothetical protein
VLVACPRAPCPLQTRPGESPIPNQIIEAIKTNAAPPAVRLAAARGMLPLSNEEMLEALVALGSDESTEVRAAAAATIDKLKPHSFISLASDVNSPPEVLGFLAIWPRSHKELLEAVVFNRATPDNALAYLAGRTNNPAIIETISLKQQSLIRTPEIIENILANPACTPEAERRAREVRAEFFEKQFGAKMVAEELRLQSEAEAAARAEEQAERDTVAVTGLDDLIRLGLIEEGVDDTLVAEYEAEFGPFDQIVHEEEEPLDISRIVEEIQTEQQEEISADRMPIFQQVALMSVKERVMLAIKGTREARMILIRDPNRIIAAAVLRNPRITDQEVESISSLKSIPEEVLRQIGQNRAWVRSYTVIHNLVRNPRCPIATGLGFLNRIQNRDLRALSLNKNIPDVIRSTAQRMYLKRTGN